jgi:uncharacterized protein YyaL (SSP411 family)
MVSTKQAEFTNHLSNETSPYLLQHAHNPVDWYPWGEEAFAKAKQENKPVLLSIGYSACHWCHVMAHESFEDEEIAKLMNELFVNIKVDREERPDLDQIYMRAVQMLTHHGGWPMTVFLTPAGLPFYGGTYFPPQDRYNMPGFPRVLISVAEAYRERQDDIKETSVSILNELRRLNTTTEANEPIGKEVLDAAYVGVVRTYDSLHGGFGGAPKFPPAMTLEFLLRTYKRTGKKEALDIVGHTCRAMADGGIYDQLGGGFHRYATDARWLVPHFEKMLYDNALLARLYLHYFQLTGEDFARKTVTGIFDYVLREMTDPAGGFYSTQDADSEGHEGKFFVWELDEIKSALGEYDASLFCAYYNVSEGGNFEGQSILNVSQSLAEVAQQNNISVAGLGEIIERGREKLFAIRESRVKPDRDDKVLTAWNGLMLASFSEAGAILNRPDYTRAAQRNAEFILSELQHEGLLLRTWKNGTAKFNAYLEDYAFLIDGLVTLFETDSQLRWFTEALSLTDRMIAEFWDGENGGFFFTGQSHEQLIVRSKDYFDNATPSGNSVAALVLLRLATLTGNETYRNHAVSILESVSDTARKYPSGFGFALSAVDFLLSTPKEIAIVGQDAAAVDEFIGEVWRTYLPNKVVAGSTADNAQAAKVIPLLENRPVTGARATAYICEHFTCKAPVTEVQALATQLQQY